MVVMSLHIILIPMQPTFAPGLGGSKYQFHGLWFDPNGDRPPPSTSLAASTLTKTSPILFSRDLIFILTIEKSILVQINCWCGGTWLVISINPRLLMLRIHENLRTSNLIVHIYISTMQGTSLLPLK